MCFIHIILPLCLVIFCISETTIVHRNGPKFIMVDEGLNMDPFQFLDKGTGAPEISSEEESEQQDIYEIMQLSNKLQSHAKNKWNKVDVKRKRSQNLTRKSGQQSRIKRNTTEVYDLAKQLPNDGELHIHTTITVHDKKNVKTENYYYICEKPNVTYLSDRICRTTRTLMQDIQFKKTQSSDSRRKTFKATAETAEDLAQQEYQQMFGSSISLSKDEEKVNNAIMRLKRKILDDNYQGSAAFYQKHFFDFKESVKSSTLYKLIKRIPKGAVLHAHDLGLLGPDYLVEVTYQPNLFVCFQKNEPSFIFSKNVPDIPCETKWLPMEEARTASKNPPQFDARLRKHFTLVMDRPKEKSNYLNFVWKKYRKYFTIVRPLLSYQPVWEKYFYDALKSFRDDNVMYVEIRSVLPLLYDLEGNVKDSIHTAGTLKKVLDMFLKDNPDFYGAKLIYSPRALISKESLKETLKTARQLKEYFPDFFAGINLIGQEDKGKPLKYYMEDLINEQEDFNYFYHAGKTYWHGGADDDLFDALALNVKRIGHSFAVVKHPLLMKEIRDKDVCLEVNVVTNMVLSDLNDVRNHPLALFLASDLPVVVSSNAPGIWEADPLTHDFYVTFIGVADKKADLRVLKKLAMNSIAYSDGNDKMEMMNRFSKQWKEFIRTMLTST